jgi:uncharacterized membrane protein
MHKLLLLVQKRRSSERKLHAGIRIERSRGSNFIRPLVVYRSHVQRNTSGFRPDAFIGEQIMSTIEKSIEVNVPVHTAYNQWTQFDDFPRFMEGIKEVRQLDDTHLHWRAEVGGKDKEWDAEITEQIPDKRIAWRSVSGARNAGVVTFHHIDDTTTRIMLQLDYEPEGIMENTGDITGMVSHRVEGDLERFKDFIESRGAETGAWRGNVQQGQPQRPGH